MYDNVKLEKSLYNLAGKTFSQALSELDPDSEYDGSELKGLDAFERQLKRFGIKVSGEDSDTVEKFFSTTQSAVLFPEFVRRAIESGFESPLLSEIAAAVSKTNSIDCRNLLVSQGSTPYSTVTAQGAALPETSITLGSSLISLSKFGRIISTSYEAIRQQRLDLFAVALKSIGSQLSKAVVSQAISTLVAGAPVVQMAGSTFNYAELAAFWGEFGEYNLTTIIASPKTMAQILSFEQMKYAYADFMATGAVKTPFGATLIKSSAVSDDMLIGLDKSCALEMIKGTELEIDSDKLIDRQIDRTAVSVTAGFSKIISDASKVLDIVK